MKVIRENYHHWTSLIKVSKLWLYVYEFCVHDAYCIRGLTGCWLLENKIIKFNERYIHHIILTFIYNIRWTLNAEHTEPIHFWFGNIDFIVALNCPIFINAYNRFQIVVRERKKNQKIQPKAQINRLSMSCWPLIKDQPLSCIYVNSFPNELDIVLMSLITFEFRDAEIVNIASPFFVFLSFYLVLLSRANIFYAIIFIFSSLKSLIVVIITDFVLPQKTIFTCRIQWNKIHIHFSVGLVDNSQFTIWMVIFFFSYLPISRMGGDFV